MRPIIEGAALRATVMAALLLIARGASADAIRSASDPTGDPGLAGASTGDEPTRAGRFPRRPGPRAIGPESSEASPRPVDETEAESDEDGPGVLLPPSSATNSEGRSPLDSRIVAPPPTEPRTGLAPQPPAPSPSPAAPPRIPPAPGGGHSGTAPTAPPALPGRDAPPAGPPVDAAPIPDPGTIPVAGPPPLFDAMFGIDPGDPPVVDLLGSPSAWPAPADDPMAWLPPAPDLTPTLTGLRWDTDVNLDRLRDSSYATEVRRMLFHGMTPDPVTLAVRDREVDAEDGTEAASVRPPVMTADVTVSAPEPASLFVLALAALGARWLAPRRPHACRTMRA